MRLVLFCIILLIYSKHLKAIDIDERIKEVYGNQVSILEKNSKRLDVLNDILFNRTLIIEEPYLEYEKYQKLSAFPLFNKYNPDVKAEIEFDKDSFNVLKYDLPFFLIYPVKYRIDGTNFIVVINPIHYEE